MNTETKLDPNRLRHFRAYEQVRRSGHYNMFDSRARAITGLSKEDYVFVMENYNELAELEDSNKK